MFGWLLVPTSLPAANTTVISGNLGDSWQVAGGWLQDSVTAIAQSRDGYLWLGTYHGLLRFDGVHFTVFDSINGKGLQNGSITSLYEDSNGALWIGHSTGDLTCYANGRFQPVKTSPNWPRGVVEGINSDGNGDLWLLNGNGFLFRLRDGLSVAVPGGASPTRTMSLARDQAGKLWLAGNGILATVEQGNVVPFHPSDEATNFSDRVFPARDGGIWVLGRERLRKWRDGRWVAEIEAGADVSRPVTVLLETHSGVVLVGTLGNGLYLLAPGAAPFCFSRTNGLSHNWIRSVCEDREGDIWVGTAGGLDELRPRKVQMLNPPDNWRGCTVLSFIVHPDGSVWAGTEGAGLYHYDGSRWNSFGDFSQLPNLFIWSVLETQQKQLLVGTWGSGLLTKNGDHFGAEGELGKITDPIAALYQDDQGVLWIGTATGLLRYEAGKLVRIPGQNNLAQPDVRTVTRSRDGTVWFGMFGGGICSWNHGVLRQYRKKDGLGSDFVVSLYADSDDTLWIGTSDNGLTRLKQGKFSVISTEQGLLSRIICHIVDDEAGDLWLGSQEGILRINKADLNRCADGLTGSITCLSYSQTEGMISPSCSGGFQPGACRAADGRLWFSTAKGLAIVNPADATINEVAPPVVIEKMLVDGEIIGSANLGTTAMAGKIIRGKAGLSAQLRIRPGGQRYEFHYTGLSFVVPDKVFFKYKLEGLEQEWVEAGTKRFAQYTYLPHGTYTFHVIACNNDGVWNKAGASVTFTILPFFWQTWWFKGLAVAGMLALVGGLTRYVIKQKMEKQLAGLQLQHALEKERARIAQDMHDDVGARLTEILLVGDQAQKSRADADKMAKQVERISSMAREMIENMDALVWAVNPRNDSLDKLAAYVNEYAQAFLETASIRCRFDIPNRLPDYRLSSKFRHNLFLVIKEALNNIVKHAECSEVRVRFEINDGFFSIFIVDNGRGFSKSTVTAGDGLQNMERRIQNIGGHFELSSEPGAGTRITARIRLTADKT